MPIHIYHLVTPRFNEGGFNEPTSTSIIFTRHHIFLVDADVPEVNPGKMIDVGEGSRRAAPR